MFAHGITGKFNALIGCIELATDSARPTIKQP